VAAHTNREYGTYVARLVAVRRLAQGRFFRMIPDVSAWDAWFPTVVAKRMTEVGAPWCIVGGWALDLFRGGPTRPHDDVEVAVPAERFAEIEACFPDCDFYVPHDGELLSATAETLISDFQTWALERATGRWRFDVFREPHDGDTWICRRDSRLRRPYAEIIQRTADGIPYLTPEIVLLFKAKDVRGKDQADFDGTLPLLDAAQRQWLGDALVTVHPGHMWASRVFSS
jgi:Aminoglycoside-2''-adenylyltransferase